MICLSGWKKTLGKHLPTFEANTHDVLAQGLLPAWLPRGLALASGTGVAAAGVPPEDLTPESALTQLLSVKNLYQQEPTKPLPKMLKKSHWEAFEKRSKSGMHAPLVADMSMEQFEEMYSSFLDDEFSVDDAASLCTLMISAPSPEASPGGIHPHCL